MRIRRKHRRAILSLLTISKYGRRISALRLSRLDICKIGRSLLEIQLLLYLRFWRFLGSLEFSCKELTAQLGAFQQVFEFFAIWNLHVILSKLELVFVGDAKLRLADALLSSQEATDESLVIW